MLSARHFLVHAPHTREPLITLGEFLAGFAEIGAELRAERRNLARAVGVRNDQRLTAPPLRRNSMDVSTAMAEGI